MSKKVTEKTERTVYLVSETDPYFFLCGTQPVTTVRVNGRVTAQFFGGPVRNDGGPVAGMHMVVPGALLARHWRNFGYLV